MCRHRRKLRIEDVEHGGFQIMCAACLLVTDRWPTLFKAWLEWLRLNREVVLAD